MPAIDSPERSDAHDQVAVLAARMLELRAKTATAQTEHERRSLLRETDSVDRRLDGLVYQLYGLTDEEISLVESGDQAARDSDGPEFTGRSMMLRDGVDGPRRVEGSFQAGPPSASKEN